MDRRTFLTLTSGAAIATVGSAQSLRSNTLAISLPWIELQAWLPNSQSLPAAQLDQLYFLDLQDEPLPTPERQVEPGRLQSHLPQTVPFAIALRLPVRGFGEVTLYADNQGQGYRPTDFPLSLNLAFAQSRLHRVRTAVTAWKNAGLPLPLTLDRRLQQASQFLQIAERTEPPARQVHWCNESLRESLWAGEEAAIAKAQQRIQQQAPRPVFKFGGLFSRTPEDAPRYDPLFQELFDFATVPLYWRYFEPQPGQPNWSEVNSTLAQLQTRNITPKGHPLVWFHEAGLPEWLGQPSYSDIKPMVQQHVQRVTAYYGDRLPYYDVVNEAHGIRWANELGFSPDQFLELTDLACRAARAGHSCTIRILNNCCLWAENVAYDQPPQRSPYQFMQACLAAEVPFEVIGLQLYYPNQDMFEIDRMLDRFCAFGKRVHLTELAVSSDTAIAPQSQLQEPRGLWHEPWNPTIQADWVEQVYTLAYSKPEIEAITWWDFADAHSFWPHGGLIDAQMQPKESFNRLRSLITQWRSA